MSEEGVWRPVAPERPHGLGAIDALPAQRGLQSADASITGPAREALESADATRNHCCACTGGVFRTSGGVPNWAIVSHKIANSGRDFCAKGHKVMVGYRRVFRMWAWASGRLRFASHRVESQIHAAKCDGCDLTSDSPEVAVATAICGTRFLFLKFTNSQSHRL